jgi:hypothetical protein
LKNGTFGSYFDPNKVSKTCIPSPMYRAFPEKEGSGTVTVEFIIERG